MGLVSRTFGAIVFGSMVFGSMLGLLAEGTRMHRFYFLAVVVAKGFAGLDSKHLPEARAAKGLNLGYRTLV